LRACKSYCGSPDKVGAAILADMDRG
jgi:hypothetical protein